MDVRVFLEELNDLIHFVSVAERRSEMKLRRDRSRRKISKWGPLQCK
jgi:hypothetical protein